MQLTPEEERLILDLREERKKKEEARQRLELTLDVAARYQAWLNKEKLGTSYSAFCNDFDYVPPDILPVSRHRLYEDVLAVIKFASELCGT